MSSELPENAKINEDTFGDDDGDCTFEFGDEEEVDIDSVHTRSRPTPGIT